MYSLVIPPINIFLNELASHVTQKELSQMKRQLGDSFPDLHGEFDKCETVRDVFSKLKKMCLIGEHNLERLEELFNEMKLYKLSKKVQEFKARTCKGAVKDIPVLNVFLNELASRVTQEKLSQMKLLLEDSVPDLKGELDRYALVRDVFSVLEKRNLIGVHNLKILEELFNNMNLYKLTAKVQEFVARTSEGAMKEIPMEQLYGENRTLPAPRYSSVSLLIDGDYAEFKPEVETHICKTISQAMGIAMKDVHFIMHLPHNSYYVIIQMPEQVVPNLESEAVSRQYWLVNLNCLEVKINDSDPILLGQERDTQHVGEANFLPTFLGNYIVDT